MIDYKVIICAGGEGIHTPNPRWKNYLGVSRHMIPAYGEPLIHRLQKQLKERGFTNIHVACLSENKDKYIKYDTNFIECPKRTLNIGDYSVIWSYRNLLNYSGITVLLFADTFYTDEIIDSIYKNLTNNFYIYGRFEKSSITKNERQGEVFAYIMHYNFITKYLQAVKRSMEVLHKHVADGITIYEDLAKYSYKKFCGIDYRDMRVENKHWIEWDDLTDDFDYPEDWDIKAKLFPHIFYIS